MNTALEKKIKYCGARLGLKARAQNKKDLLYELKNCKTLKELLRLPYMEGLQNNIISSGKSLDEVITMLLIHAANSYIRPRKIQKEAPTVLDENPEESKYFTTDESLIKLIKAMKNFGIKLGRHEYQNNKRIFLYELKDCINKNMLLKTISRIQINYEIYVNPIIVEEIISEKLIPWMQIKNLLCIYSMNAYILASNPKKEDKAKVSVK